MRQFEPAYPLLCMHISIHILLVNRLHNAHRVIPFYRIKWIRINIKRLLYEAEKPTFQQNNVSPK